MPDSPMSRTERSGSERYEDLEQVVVGLFRDVLADQVTRPVSVALDLLERLTECGIGFERRRL